MKKEKFISHNFGEEPPKNVIKFANLVLGGAAVACSGIFLYFFYYYNWTHLRHFTSPTGPVLYEDTPAVGAIMLLSSLRLNSSFRINLALSLLTLGISLYTTEIVLAISDSALLNNAYDRDAKLYFQSRDTQIEKARTAKLAKQFGVDFDVRDRLEVILDLEKQNINAVPTLSPSLLLKEQNNIVRSEIAIGGDEVLPLSGVANKVTVFCNENGEYPIYKSDEHGFHNPPGMWGGESPVDIVALGDSFAHGACVPSDKNFVALIRKHYSATLNLGIQGNGPLTELAILKEYVPYFKPKVVLWFYCENDLDDLHTEEKSLLLMRYMNETNFSQNLFVRQASIDQALEAYAAAAKNAKMLSKLIGRAKRTDMDLPGLINGLEGVVKLGTLRQRLGLVLGSVSIGGDRGIPEKDKDLVLFSEILRQAEAFISSWGGSLYFVYLTSWRDYASSATVNKRRDQILTLAKTLGICVIDLDPAFRAQRDPLTFFPFRQDGHYNEEGHRLVAEAVIEELSRRPALSNDDSKADRNDSIWSNRDAQYSNH